MTQDLTEKFNVVQFFEDGSYHYEGRNLNAEQAVAMAAKFTNTVGVRLGIVKRIIITDMGDCTCFEWTPSEGVTYPIQRKKEI